MTNGGAGTGVNTAKQLRQTGGMPDCMNAGSLMSKPVKTDELPYHMTRVWVAGCYVTAVVNWNLH